MTDRLFPHVLIRSQPPGQLLLSVYCPCGQKSLPEQIHQHREGSWKKMETSAKVGTPKARRLEWHPVAWSHEQHSTEGGGGFLVHTLAAAGGRLSVGFSSNSCVLRVCNLESALGVCNEPVPLSAPLSYLSFSPFPSLLKCEISSAWGPQVTRWRPTGDSVQVGEVSYHLWYKGWYSAGSICITNCKLCADQII